MKISPGPDRVDVPMLVEVAYCIRWNMTFLLLSKEEARLARRV
jgi:hypothetical protein